MKVSVQIVLFAGLILAALYGVNFAYAVSKGAEGGTFGDTFGAVNALFSGSALYFLVLAFFSQREELSIMREERNENRQLISEQQKLFGAQRSALDKQAFEQSFYSLFSLTNQEKARLLQDNPRARTQLPEIQRISRAAHDLLLNFAIGAQFEPMKKVELDLLADQSFNLVNLLSSLVGLVDSFPANDDEKGRYFSMIQGLVDYHIAVCFSWFHGCSGGQSKEITLAYLKLSIHFSTSPAVRDAMDLILAKFEDKRSEVFTANL